MLVERVGISSGRICDEEKRPAVVASGGGSRALLKQTRSRVDRAHLTSFEAAVERQRVEMGRHFASGTWMDVIIQKRCSHLGGFSIAAQRRGREEKFKNMDRISSQL